MVGAVSCQSASSQCGCRLWQAWESWLQEALHSSRSQEVDAMQKKLFWIRMRVIFENCLDHSSYNWMLLSFAWRAWYWVEEEEQEALRSRHPEGAAGSDQKQRNEAWHGKQVYAALQGLGTSRRRLSLRLCAALIGIRLVC